MEQKGNDNEGILGFLVEDIQKELRRGKRLVRQRLRYVYFIIISFILYYSLFHNDYKFIFTFWIYILRYALIVKKMVLH